MKTAEIFSIGDELLRGIVQDTNSHWLTKRITARGAAVTRVTVLPDEPSVVAAELRRAFERAPTIVVTQGGLGPTDDDRTRQGVALAIGADLVPHPGAESIVLRRYGELQAAGSVADATLDDARARMASLPTGATPLDNQIGTAPGVLLAHGGTTIVCLPGVPPELHWIWDNSLAAALEELLGPGGYAETTITLDLLDESKIAWLLAMLQERHRGVYVKSRASGFGERDQVRVTLSAAGADRDEAERAVGAALGDLRAALAAESIGVIELG